MNTTSTSDQLDLFKGADQYQRAALQRWRHNPIGDIRPFHYQRRALMKDLHHALCRIVQKMLDPEYVPRPTQRRFKPRST